MPATSPLAHGSAEMLAARILIAGDQEVNVGLVEQTVRQAGYENVSTTRDPESVCALHRRDHYDLIVLDLRMPGRDGFQVMQALKSNDPHLPVLAITAQPGQQLRALQAGAKDFISTPFELVEVKTRMHNMLEPRLLYQRIEELRESEARYRSLTELASDWYWEQDADGTFTTVSGPVLEMLGLRVDPLADPGGAGAGWNPHQHKELQAAIAARQPFLDFIVTRTSADGTVQRFQVSGEPKFGPACNLVGYRGIGLEITDRK